MDISNGEILSSVSYPDFNPNNNYSFNENNLINRVVQACTTLLIKLSVSYTHLRAHETDSYLVCRLLLEKKK